ncbi:MAG TPA: endo-1,4-beta-xylanase [Spirochaetota bacterium]|nr:endo-1,4-beta-xylanase [Spirochaetota bacterium]
MIAFLKKTIIIFYIIICSSCFKRPVTAPGDDHIYPDTLRGRADKQGLILGAAISTERLAETNFIDILTNEFNCIVAENQMKFSYLEPAENNFTFTEADEIITFAKTHNMKVRGHTLIWHSDSQLPAWVKSKSSNEIKAVAENHIAKILTHMTGEIYAWDVANEIFKDDASGLRNRQETDNAYSPWAFSATDDTIIKAAFYKAKEIAETYNDNVKLMLCDYNNETMGRAKADLMYNTVADWVAQGVPIDGVAFQCHFGTEWSYNFNQIKANIDRYQELGLIVEITEFDVAIPEPVTDTDTQLETQFYSEIMNIVLAKNLPAFLTWGLTDKYSWLNTCFTGKDPGLLFDENYQKKDAYYAVKNSLNN